MQLNRIDKKISLSDIGFFAFDKRVIGQILAVFDTAALRYHHFSQRPLHDLVLLFYRQLGVAAGNNLRQRGFIDGRSRRVFLNIAFGILRILYQRSDKVV